jgi:hypothetical protein
MIEDHQDKVHRTDIQHRMEAVEDHTELHQEVDIIKLCRMILDAEVIRQLQCQCQWIKHVCNQDTIHIEDQNFMIHI